MKYIKKLIKNFHLSEKLLKKNFPSYNSIHWKKFNQNKIINKRNIINFRRNQLSYGLDDQDITNFEFFGKISNLVGETFLLKNILKKNIGNSNKVFKFDKYYIDFNQLVFIYWFKQIKKYLLPDKVKIVCEIGGGFGQFSEIILNNKKNTKLIYIDLPLSNLLTSFYLKQNFPKKKFYFYENYLKKNILRREDINKYDIFILPPNCNFEKDLKIDFFINMRSMMEMKKSTIDTYFNFIHKHASRKSHFFNLNRFHKKIGNEIISIENFNYDNNWDVVISGQAFNQDWIYYILTRREFKKYKNNITNEKKIIKKIGRNYRYNTNIIFVLFRNFITQLTSLVVKFAYFIFGDKTIKRIIDRLALKKK